MNEIKVPYQRDKDARPNYCFVNVEARVAEDGGRSVLGWSVQTECEGLVNAYYHHGVWERPSGELVEITPKVWWDGTAYAEPTRFVPDPAALPTGEAPYRSALPPRYVPLVEDEDVRRFAEFFQTGEAAYYEGNMRSCAYYTGRAEQVINRYLRRAGKPPMRFGLPTAAVCPF